MSDMAAGNLTPFYFCPSFWVRVGLLTQFGLLDATVGLKWLLGTSRDYRISQVNV